MGEVLRGPLRIAYVATATGAGGDIAASIRPPAGEIWDVHLVRGGHNGAAGLTCVWYFQDVIGAVLFNCGGGATQPRSFHTDVGGVAGGPIRLHNGTYLTFQVNAIAGALVVGVTAVYERIVGAALAGA